MDALLTQHLFDGLIRTTETPRPAGEDLLEPLLDELAFGVVVIRADGRVLHANQRARIELDSHRLVTESQGFLHAANPENAKAFHDAMASATSGKRAQLTLQLGNDGFAVTLAFVPLKPGPGRAPSVAIFFSRAFVCEALMLSFFARNHGLTMTEELVLSLLCQGYTTPEVARQMKVAVSTARTHVRNMCTKARAGGLRELVNRVSVLPPLGGVVLVKPLH